MQTNVSIADGIHIIGVNDRRTQLFENIWPLPCGVSYNSYLIVDEKCALLDTVDFGSDGTYLERVEEILGGRSLDYLVVNHMEPDHSGEIGSVLRRFPDVKIVGNSLTFKILLSYFGDVSANFHEVKDCEAISLGRRTLRFYTTPWVHWPETMMTYEETEKILFSADAFGTFGTTDGAVTDDMVDIKSYEDEMRRYYSNIVGKFGGMVQKALCKLGSLEIKMICPLHGPVWKRQIAEVVGLYDKWSKGDADESVVVIYASMYNNTAQMADHVASVISQSGVKDVKVYDVSKTHLSYLISELWRCRYVVLASCAYNGDMFPLMEQLCTSISHYGLKGRSLAYFGSYSFNGGGVRSLKKFAESSGWDIICEPVDIFGRATAENLAKLEPLAEAVAQSVKNNTGGR